MSSITTKRNLVHPIGMLSTANDITWILYLCFVYKINGLTNQSLKENTDSKSKQLYDMDVTSCSNIGVALVKWDYILSHFNLHVYRYDIQGKRKKKKKNDHSSENCQELV